MNEFWQGLTGLLTGEQWLSGLRAGLLVIFGIIFARVAANAFDRAIRGRYQVHERMLARRIIIATVVGLVIASALHQLGFQIGVLLGAAGILTVAIGFASQTSVSNLISGLFLVAERPFVVGDVITIEMDTGEVLSIDLLSTKLRTFDNLLVRVPNEKIIKSTVKNLTRFPIRRFEIPVSVARHEDVARVQAVVKDVVDANPLCLEEPAPAVLFRMFGESSIDLELRAWTRRENILEVRTTIPLSIKQRFEAEGIEIPYPHRVLYEAKRGS